MCLKICKIILVIKHFLSIRWFSSEDFVKEKKKKCSTKKDDDRRKMMLHFQLHKTMKDVKSKQDSGNSQATARKKNGFTQIIGHYYMFLDLKKQFGPEKI